MTDQAIETQTTTEEQTSAEPAFDRAHPAFLAVTRQVTELEAKLAERDAAEAEAQAKAEKAALAAKEDWAGLEAKYKAEAEQAAAEHKAAMEQLQANVERERNKARLGVQDPVHQEFLMDAYQKAEDQKDSFEDWVEYAKTVDSFKPFFGIADGDPLPPAPGGAAATRSARGSLEDRLKSPDPAVAKAAKEEYLLKVRGG
jgi:hypothetical protein